MNIKEIVTFLEKMVDDRQDKVLPGCLGWDEIEPLQEAIALLRTHPEAQPNEPLTLLEDLLKMDKQPVWSSREHVWGLLDIGLGCVVSSNGDLDINVAVATRTLYRRPPKEESH